MLCNQTVLLKNSEGTFFAILVARHRVLCFFNNKSKNYNYKILTFIRASKFKVTSNLRQSVTKLKTGVKLGELAPKIANFKEVALLSLIC